MYGDTTFWTYLVNIFVLFLFIMWFWLLISVFGDLFRRRDMSAVLKVIWMVFLIALPYLGVFAYLLTQSRSMQERDAEAARLARDELRASIGFSVADEIAKLEKLKADGTISADEFTKLRAKLV
jgi:energy-coupling factor transporter transmembrane protein EcfT